MTGVQTCALPIFKSADALANASGAMFRKDDISGSNHLRTSTTTTITKTAPRTVRPPDPVRSQFREFHFRVSPTGQKPPSGCVPNIRRKRRNGPPKWAAHTHPGNPQARMATGLLVRRFTRPHPRGGATTDHHPDHPPTPRSTPPPAPTPPAQTSPADQHQAQTPRQHTTGHNEPAINHRSRPGQQRPGVK